MTELMKLAEQYGVTVELCHIDDAAGFYDPIAQRISLEIDLTPDELRSTFAHELGHVHHGHTCDLGPDSPIERQADAFAARLLVDPEEYAAAERISSDVHYLADELSVTPDVVDAFRRYVLKKFGHRTYADHRRVAV